MSTPKKTKNPLDELKRIERDVRELGRRMREENRIMAAEQADRLRLGITGDAAVQHFNDWMMLHGLPHLVVD